ncbi:MAG TPA: thioredoxin domain-containing protein [Acidimicrobiales bacterium]|nr:thioredoxin domain-containing protein [Acidimicrobiales bacterium]
MNRLAAETSPYLRQHADNPVDWYPWNDEAFERARAEDKPVLLSVGYSACHWCHVMAHESFEDAATAAVMNELFVNIKVDREERPDVDAVYMEAVQAVTGQGGWPMTVFLTPDGRPFFGGTYFPPRSMHGRPGFVELMQAVAEAWRTERPQVEAQADQLAEAVRSRTTVEGSGGGSVAPALLERGYAALRSSFDPEWGGFGRAPKFPMPANLELLLRAWSHNRSDDTQQMVVTTLDAMASGGIYDHLGGGFSRYSVDAFWMVPHFEKMLYDNALLVSVYLHAWQAFGEARYQQVVEETVGYVLRDLRSPEGGVYSAEDADSEGEEGKFYVWRIEDLEPELVEWYGATTSGNFEGHNILHRPVRGDLLRPAEVEAARQRQFELREKRVRPGLDDKVVTEWNGMFVAGLASAGAAFGRDEWVRTAEETAEFLWSTLRRADGRWLRSWQRDGEARVLAYAVDYAWLVEAFVRLAEASGRAVWIERAREVADGLLSLFADPDGAGFFTTGHDAERLIVRQKDLFDGATPAANSVACVALLRLAALTGDERYSAAAGGVLSLLAEPMEHHPAAFSWLLGAVDLVVTGVTEVAVVGDRPDLVRAVQERYLPTAVLAWGEPYGSPLWESRSDGLAYVCRNYACQSPAPDIDTLLRQLA